MKKKILLAITRDNQIYKCIVENFNFIGKECELLEVPLSERELKTSWIFRIKIFYKKYIEKNKRYVDKYNDNRLEVNINKWIKENSNKFEACLMIRPDLYSQKIINTVIQNIENTYGYQWDGLDRFPKVLDIIPKFKHFYIYDKNDKNKFPNTSITTNFYFDCYKNKNKSNPTYDIYYVGFYDERIEEVLDLCSKLAKMNFKMKILIFSTRENRGKLKKYSFIEEIRKPISYYENLENVFNSKIILDFVHKKTHKGLSFRPFEAIGYKKKIITTNSMIKDYDFYNKNNIYVYGDNRNDLKEFLDSQYEDLNPLIFEKYSFTNWIKYILKLGSAIPVKN